MAFKLHANRHKHARLVLPVACCVTMAILASGFDLFSIKYVELLDLSRLIATSGMNYAFTSPKLMARNWRTVSVNGDTVCVIGPEGVRLTRSRAELDPAELLFIESLKEEIASGRTGYKYMTTMSGGSMGGGGFMMSSSDGFGGSSMGSGMAVSSSSGGGGFTSSSNGNGMSFTSNGLSVTMMDEDNMSVSRQDFPFAWSKVFFNGDLVTLILRNGDVRMMPFESLDPAEATYLATIKQQVKDYRRIQAQQVANTMSGSMNMISSIFNGIMSNFNGMPGFGAAPASPFGGMGMGMGMGMGGGAVAIAG